MKTNKNTHYYSSVEDTKKYGHVKAAIIGRVQNWCNHNEKIKDMEKFHNGFWWSGWLSARELEEQTGINKKTLSKHIKELVDMGLLIKGNFNKIGIDRTGWYRINAEYTPTIEVSIPPIEAPISLIEESIPQIEATSPTIEATMPIIEVTIPVSPVSPNSQPVSPPINPPVKQYDYSNGVPELKDYDKLRRIERDTAKEDIDSLRTFINSGPLTRLCMDTWNKYLPKINEGFKTRYTKCEKLIYE